MSEPAEYQPSSPSLPASGERAQPSLLPTAVTPLPALRHLTAVSRVMHQMLEACLTEAGGPPDVESVHQLRSGTRRVEATLETLAREAGTRGLGARTEQARQRWLRQLKKVRQASGMVRDLDVHREILAEHYLPSQDLTEESAVRELTATDAAASKPALKGAAKAHDEHALFRQARVLDRWLAARRTTAAEELRAALQQRDAKLAQAEQQFVTAWGARRSAAHGSRRPAALLALEDYLRLMDAMPHLDAENLHDFRKGAKKARYVAEAGEEDAAANAIAKAIKRVQDAIGDWHDWEVLAQESHEALKHDGAALEAELSHRVEHYYQRAMRTAATQGRRLVGEWLAMRPGARHNARHMRGTVNDAVV